MRIGARLKCLRTDKGVSQAIIAKYLGITNQAYSLYELDKREPDYESLLKIADYFDVSVDYLLGNEEKENSDVTDTDIKVALFGGDAKVISDAAWNDVKAFAQKVAEIERKRKEYDAK